MLSESAQSYSQVLDEFALIREEFRKAYRGMLERVLQSECNVTVCTVYDSVPDLEPPAHAVLSIFNQIILREAFAVRVPVIDFRPICTEASDFSELSPIEPSHLGGEKIVSVISTILTDNASSRRSTIVHR